MDDAMKLIIDIWNSLSPEGRKLWIGEGQVLPTLKNGRYENANLMRSGMLTQIKFWQL